LEVFVRVGVRDFALYLRPRESGRAVYYEPFHAEAGGWTAGRSTGQTVRALAEAWATAEVKRREQEADRAEQERQAGITLVLFAGYDFLSYDGRWAIDRRASGKRLSRRLSRFASYLTVKRQLPLFGHMGNCTN
jgi:hypothetical protein